jgi:hypothetical protein
LKFRISVFVNFLVSVISMTAPPASIQR